MHSFVKQLVGSVVRINFYKEAIQRPVSKAMVYLLLLNLCVCAALGVRLYMDVSPQIEHLMIDFQTKAPDFVFENQTLRSDAKVPYVLKTEDSWCIFALDPSGQMDENTLAQYENGWMISKHNLVGRAKGKEIIRCNFAELSNVRVTKQDVVHWLPYIKYTVIIAKLLDLLVGYCFIKFASVLLLYFFGSIVAAVINVKIRFADLCKIAIYSLTLPIILEMLTKLAVMENPVFIWIYCGVAMGYVITVLWSLRKQQRQISGKAV